MTPRIRTPPIEGAVDIDAIHQHKENVLPLSTGRSASKLTGLLSKDRKSVELELREGHSGFRQEIAEVEADPDSIDDALDVYHRYALYISLYWLIYH